MHESTKQLNWKESALCGEETCLGKKKIFLGVKEGDEEDLIDKFEDLIWYEFSWFSRSDLG